jgi:nitronate monooxygenase
MSDWTNTEITKRPQYRVSHHSRPLWTWWIRCTPDSDRFKCWRPYGANDLSPEIASDIRKFTDKPFGLNLWVSNSDPGGETLTAETYERVTKLLEPYYKELKIEIPPIPILKLQNFEDQVAALIEVRPAGVQFCFWYTFAGHPEVVSREGIVTIGAATTVDEAIACERAGVDCVISSGFEAGGHRPSFLQTR